MPVKIICFLAILITLNISYAAKHTANKITNKQEEILLELADAGIEESYWVLARFYEQRIAFHNDFFNKSIYWYIQAAKIGHMGSIYRLGEEGLKFSSRKNKFRGTYIKQEDAKKKWRKESLILISIAALLENRYAKTDLVMLPKFRSISYQEIDSAFEKALIRMNQGMLINCDFFVCIENKTNTININRLAKYRHFILNFNQERSRLKCNPLKECLEAMLSRVNFLDQNSINQFNLEVAKVNLPKINKNQRLRNEKNAKLLENWDQQSNRDRKSQRFLAAQKVINHFADEDRKKLMPKIRELLDKINYHRAPNNKITLSTVMAILSQP